MGESAHVKKESESISDSVSVNSAEPEDVEDLEQLANDICGKVKMKIVSCRHGFYYDDTVRQISDDSDNEAEPLKCYDVHFTILDKFEDGWKMELPTTFDRYVGDDYIPPNCGLTIDIPDDNIITWTIFSCLLQMILSQRFAGL